MGDSVGHWEGDTLVGRDAQLPSRAEFPRLVRECGGDRALHARRRTDQIIYRFTVDDPTTFTSSFTRRAAVRRQSTPTSTSTPATKATTRCRHPHRRARGRRRAAACMRDELLFVALCALLLLAAIARAGAMGASVVHARVRLGWRSSASGPTRFICRDGYDDHRT